MGKQFGFAKPALAQATFLCFWLSNVFFVVSAASAEDDSIRNFKILMGESAMRVITLEGSDVLESDKLNKLELEIARSFIDSRRDYTCYHLLFSIKHHYPEVYKAISSDSKAAILTSMLAETVTMNEWGALWPVEPMDGVPSRVLLDTRMSATKYLTQLLDNQKPAYLQSILSGPSTPSILYKYRRADYAYRYLMLLRQERALRNTTGSMMGLLSSPQGYGPLLSTFAFLGERIYSTPTFAFNPDERDKAIERLKQELAKEQ